MEKKNLEQVRKLIERIADSYDPPTKRQTEKMQKLTGMDWNAEDLQMQCCEYWSHHSLDETAYWLFHGHYPPVRDVDLIFWKYKPGVVLDDRTVFEKYCLGKGNLKALEALPLDAMLREIAARFPGWEQSDAESSARRWLFACPEQPDYWTNIHFRIWEYGRDVEAQREHQIVKIGCHNMSEEQIGRLTACMESFPCTLHIREEKTGGGSEADA